MKNSRIQIGLLVMTMLLVLADKVFAGGPPPPPPVGAPDGGASVLLLGLSVAGLALGRKWFR